MCRRMYSKNKSTESGAQEHQVVVWWLVKCWQLSYFFAHSFSTCVRRRRPLVVFPCGGITFRAAQAKFAQINLRKCGKINT